MKAIKVISILLCTLLFTGCWGMQEIEERAFVLSFGIDKVSEEEGKNKFEIAIINPDTAEAKEGKVQDFSVISTKSTSFNSGIIQLLQKFSKSFNYEHTKIFLLGENLLKDENSLKIVLDILTRDRQFHSSIIIFMVPSPKKITDILDIKPKTKTLLSFYISGIAEHELESARIGKILFHDFMRIITTNEGDGVIPIIIPEEDEAIVSGMGILKDYKLIGKLDDEETIAYRWCDNRVKGGVIELVEADRNTPFIYRRFNRKIKLDKIEDNIVHLKYIMNAEGAIEEYILDEKLIEEGTIKRLKMGLEEYMKGQCEDIIKKMQEDYKVDLIGARDYLRKYHPSLHDKVSENYQDFFQNNLKIDVEINIKIGRIGKTL